MKIDKCKIKKNIALMLVLMLIFSVSGCGSQETFYETGLGGLGSANGTGLASGDEGDDEDSGEDSGDSDTVDYVEQEYAETENADFQEFIWNYFKDTVTDSAMSYNQYIMYDDSYDLDKDSIVATLGDATISDATIAEDKKEDEDFYNELLEFEDAELTEDERFTYECMKCDTEIAMHYYDNPYLDDPFSPMRGLQSNIVSAFLEYRFDDKGDIDDYLEMLSQVRDYFGGMIEYEKARSEKGLFMNDKNADDVIQQCDDMLEKTEDNIMITEFGEMLGKLDFITAEEKAAYEETNKEIVLSTVLPAFEDLKAAFQELKGTCKNENGLYYFDGGKDFYQNYIFPVYSGSAKTVDEEIAFLDSRANTLITNMMTLSYSYPDAYQDYSDNYGEFFKIYDDLGPKGIIDMLQEDYMEDFPFEEKVPFEVDYMSDTLSKLHKSTLAYYNTNPADNPDYNIIKVNSLSTEGVFDTLAHESFPGHAFQFWYFRSTKPNPGRILESNLGYVEGWAVYSAYQTCLKCDLDGRENADIIMQLNNIDQEFGYLMAERVDLGVNYEGWTYDDALDYLSEWGMGEDALEYWFDAATGDPGIFLSYSVGYYEMNELREKAEDALGDKFVAKDFHKVILDAGPCQYAMLEKKVDKYIHDNQ